MTDGKAAWHSLRRHGQDTDPSPLPYVRVSEKRYTRPSDTLIQLQCSILSTFAGRARQGFRESFSISLSFSRLSRFRPAAPARLSSGVAISQGRIFRIVHAHEDDSRVVNVENLRVDPLRSLQPTLGGDRSRSENAYRRLYSDSM